MDEVKLLPSPIERLAEHLSARWTIPTSREAVAHWIDYSLNRCGLVVVEEQFLTRPPIGTDEVVERVARAISNAAWDNMWAQGFSGGWDHDELGRAIARSAIWIERLRDDVPEPPQPCPTCGAKHPFDNVFCSDGFHAPPAQPENDQCQD